MDDRERVRKHILNAFGVTEEELADDRGYAHARAEADAQTEAFMRWMHERREKMLTDITAELLPDVRLPDTCDCWTDDELAARDLYCPACTAEMEADDE